MENYNCKSAIILGMHDAIVSLTGLIAELFFAFTDTNIIVISCILSSITASLSMGASNYLAVKSVNATKALSAALYTGIAYMATCILLVLPFLIFSDTNYFALISVILTVILIIFFFNLFFYRKRKFYKHFFEMLSICTIVSIIAFFIGDFASKFIGT